MWLAPRLRLTCQKVIRCLEESPIGFACTLLADARLHDNARDDFDLTNNTGCLIPGSDEWKAFESKCEAARQHYCSKLWQTSASDALDGNQGSVPFRTTFTEFETRKWC